MLLTTCPDLHLPRPTPCSDGVNTLDLGLIKASRRTEVAIWASLVLLYLRVQVLQPLPDISSHSPQLQRLLPPPEQYWLSPWRNLKPVPES